jgi:hypothetical protein
MLFVLPIHNEDRFTAALSSFLAEVDRYIEVYVIHLQCCFMVTVLAVVSISQSPYSLFCLVN